MQKKQATGVDTRAMLPLYVSLFIFLCFCAFPWISIPVLKYSKLQTTDTFWNIEQCICNIQESIRSGGMLHMGSDTFDLDCHTICHLFRYFLFE